MCSRPTCDEIITDYPCCGDKLCFLGNLEVFGLTSDPPAELE